MKTTEFLVNTLFRESFRLPPLPEFLALIFIFIPNCTFQFNQTNE